MEPDKPIFNNMLTICDVLEYRRISVELSKDWNLVKKETNSGNGNRDINQEIPILYVPISHVSLPDLSEGVHYKKTTKNHHTIDNALIPIVTIQTLLRSTFYILYREVCMFIVH